MNDLQFLTWVRGTGLDITIGIFLLGVLWRLFEIYSLGRKPDFAGAPGGDRGFSDKPGKSWGKPAKPDFVRPGDDRPKKKKPKSNAG